MKVSLIPAIVLAMFILAVPGCQKPEEKHEEEARRIVATSPVSQDVTVTQPYVCQIHSSRHIEVRALESGYLEPITVSEGQSVKQGDLLFKILPTLYQARLDSEIAEAKLAEIERNNAAQLLKEGTYSAPALALAEAKLAKANAKVELARAEFNFTELRAPFDGIIDRLHEQQGSLIEEGDMLTTLSDNSLMWVYFNVPEARYLEYKSANEEMNLQIELVLANGKKFDQPGKIGAIEADFNNETGNIAFRADFPNPNRLLRYGQTGTILIHHLVKDAVVIPQRATFEILDKNFVYVIGEDGVVHQRNVDIENEMDDIYLIKDGVDSNDKIVLEGVREVHEGEKVEYEYSDPEEVLANLKYRAE